MKKSKLFDHMGLKILSLLIAIAVWIVVANVDDYKTTRQIMGIKIEFINGDAITSRNKVYEVPEGTTVDVVVKGRRKIVENLTSDDFKAVADLSKMSVTNAVAVEVTAVSSAINRELSISNTTNSVVVAMENKIERQLPVVVRPVSDVAEGYAISNKSATPNLLTVRGAESVVNAIEDVVVDVDVSGKSKSVTMQAPPVFLDKSGVILDPSKFEYDVTQIDTLVEILPTKEIHVKLGTTGEPADGYEVARVEYQPTSIYVVGKAVTLSQLNEIVIEDIDVTGCSENIETSIEILGYLPEGVSLVGDNSEIMVQVFIEKLVEKNITLNMTDINMIGKDDSLNYAFSAPVQLTVRGLSERLDKLTISLFGPSIDVTGLGKGEHKISLKLKELEGIRVMAPDGENVEITIVITEKE